MLLTHPAAPCFLPPDMSNPIPSNAPGSREFEETMQAFERMHAKGAKREGREFWKLGAYYADGKTNELFKGFLHGMAYARALANMA